MLKIKWTDRITNDEVFQRAKEERLLLKMSNSRRHSWIGYIIRHNEFVVNILEGAISGKKAMGRPRLQYLTLRLLMSCIYMEHLFLMFLDHTQRRTTVGRTPLDD